MYMFGPRKKKNTAKTVDSVMHPYVSELDINEGAKKAAEMFSKSDVSQIIVKENDEPKWILDISKLTPTALRENSPLGNLQLSPAHIMHSGDPISMIIDSIKLLPAIVIDPAYPKKVKGIITVSDVSKAI